MGWSFQLEHANLVAYLTVRHARCPQAKYLDVASFLKALEYRWNEVFISNDKSWPEKMGRKAAVSLKAIPKDKHYSNEPVSPEDLEMLTGPLREELLKYSFYALAIFDPDDQNQNKRLSAFMTNGAYGSETAGLFLISDQWRNFNYGFLDPFPPLQAFARNPSQAPGVVFWNEDACVFVHVTQADRVLAQIMQAGRVSSSAITRVLQDYELGSEDKHLLHLSDLHFGKPRSTALQEHLIASIADEARSVDRVVVTGDLFDSPNAEAMDAFLNFRYQLERLTNKDLVIVPGNHDESFKGNRLGSLGKDLQQVASLEWSSLVIDNEMRCVFFGFDSSLDANLAAQGVVTQEQLIRIGTQYQTRLDRNPDLANYLSVALIHHHPFSWNSTEPKIMGVSLENLLVLDHPEVFLNWCVRRQIPLILHGHKHHPRHVCDYVETDDGGGWVTSVGCGSSLGAEGGPLSYNILSWHPTSRKWSASFMADPGDASGFKPRYVSVSSINSN
jgi:predicted MPP superfamily phosphohydrolase